MSPHRLLAALVVIAACRRSATAPYVEPPRVYEQGDCAQVMALPSMSSDEVARGVVSIGITAAQNRVQVTRAWNQAHRGHWVRWSLRADQTASNGSAPSSENFFARCLDGSVGLQLVQLNAASLQAMRALRGGERVRVDGWLDSRGVVTLTQLHVESLTVEAPAEVAPAPPPAPEPEPLKPPEPPTPRSRRHRGH